MPVNKYFPVLVQLLPKNDPRHKKWLEGLKKRPSSKGKSKENDPRALRISETFKKNKINNFAAWRNRMISEGKIKVTYSSFDKSINLALLIGLILGDGNIHRFPRTEKLTITLGLDKPKLIDFAKMLVESIFNKVARVAKYKDSNAVRITLYQKEISRRLNIPCGSRRNSKKGMPGWIWSSNHYLISCLKGLYEAEAYLSIHLRTSTYNFAFANRNAKLLKDVETALKRLGLHPEVRPYAIRLRKKYEVKYFQDLIDFREYTAG